MKINVAKQKEILSKFVQNRPIPNKIKANILSEDFIKQNPEIYLYYPKLFNNCFSDFNQEKVDLLCIAGFLYYQSIVHADKLYDELIPSGNRDIHLLVGVIETCQQESIKILTHLFGLNSEIWSFWQQRKTELLSAIKTSSQGQVKKSVHDFEILADFKSSFGKIAIDCLDILTKEGNKEVKEKLFLSHKYFYCGFQIIDDIVDFKSDLSNAQYNFAVQSLYERLDIEGTEIEELSHDLLYKYFFVKQLHLPLIELAIGYLEKAKEAVKEFDLPEWKQIINVKKNDSIRLQFEIENRLTITKSKVTLSLERIKNPSSIEKSITLAKSFISKKQKENGSWEDYVNQGGISDIWTTGFVLYNISDPYVHFDEGLRKKAVNFLLDKKNSFGWGYNSTWINDADSTNFALLALQANGIQAFKYIEILYPYYILDGGIRTYYNHEQLISELNDPTLKTARGWTESHKCVTAVSLLLLLKDSEISNGLAKNLLSYLIDQKGADNLWESYWWTSPIYSTSFMVECFNLLETHTTINTENTINSLLKFQDHDGSFGDDFTKDSVFYTALVVRALCHANTFSAYKSYIEKAIKFLIVNQFDDGSWAGTNALRIPHPSQKTDSSDWPVKEYGTNVRSPEFNRLFSTSLALQALGKYAFFNKK